MQQKSRNIFYIFSVLYVLVFTGVLVFPSGSDSFRTAFFDIAEMTPAWIAAIFGLIYARRARPSSPTYYGWILLGLSGLGYGVGQSIWTYYEVVLKVESPFPSWADAGYIAEQLCFVASVFVLFGCIPIVGRVRLLLDSAIAMTSVGLLLWYVLVAQMWDDSTTSLLLRVLSVAYPVLDTLALYGVVVLLCSTWRNRSLRQSIGLMGAGIATIAIADIGFTYYSLQGTFRTGSWPDAGWGFGWLLNAHALWIRLTASREEDEAESNSEAAFERGPQKSPLQIAARLLLPYLLAATTLTFVAVYDLKYEGKVSYPVIIWGSIMLVLVVVRQVLTILENHYLAQQMASLLALTKAVNNTLDVENVLSVATEHVRRLVSADGVAAWLATPETPENNRLFSVENKTDGAAHDHPSHDRLAHDRLRLVRAIESAKRHSDPLPQVPAVPQLSHASSVEAAAFSGRVFDDVENTYPHIADCLQFPLLRHGEPVGALAIMRQSSHFTPVERQLLENISLEVGSAVTNAISHRAALEAADRDPVTGLFNHRAIHQRLKAEFERAAAESSPLTVIMMDMNDFKFFNDTYGHPVGDRVLQRVAENLRKVCRETDILGRYGGDEFIAILPGIDGPSGRVIAERMRTRTIDKGFQEPGGSTIPITISCGVATFPEDNSNRHELLALADANLYQAKLSKNGVHTTSDIQRSSSELRSNGTYQFLDGLVAAVNNKDSYTRRHSEDVTEFALWIAEELRLDEESRRIISMGGLLHDVGKIGVPDEILRKPGPLNEDEFEAVKLHPLLGALIVAGVPEMLPIYDIVRSHHERWDGEGYPDGLCGEAIPFLGRLVAVADAFSAMTTTRPYRKKLDWEFAIRQIEKGRGTQFDPQLVDAFLQSPHIRRISHRVLN